MLVLLEKLCSYGQEHLAQYLKKCNEEEKNSLLAQLQELDFAHLDKLIKEYVVKKPLFTIPDDLAPAPFFPYPAETPEQKEYYKKAEEVGIELLKKGKIGLLTVAGGQGTRLGFDGPKGTYPITPVKKKSLFQYFAEKLTRVSEKYGANLHWFIMTSKINDGATKAFFKENDFFGFPAENIHFFTQGTMPAIGYDGKLLLGGKDTLALSPDGHGGTFLALKKSGSLAMMKELGIEYLSYFQIDNPLVPMADPLFLGLHHLEESEMSSRMLPKTNAKEKLGNFCITKGKLEIIEYSDMPDALAERTNPDGTLSFLAGSPAIHVISCSFVERLTEKGILNLPWHRADKKVPFLDENNNIIKPEEPNAVKLESFIFDALPLAKNPMILEGARSEHFAPTKNPTGVDSVESCREMLSVRDAKRLALAGIRVPENVTVEISPKSVCDEEDAVKVPLKEIHVAEGMFYYE